MTDYKIDIDINDESFTPAFKEFYHTHFVNSWGLRRREVDTSFFTSMTEEEKNIAKRLVRQNLPLIQNHLIEAAGELQDEEVLPILYQLFESCQDFSRQLTIGRAIWKINGDVLYPELLKKLKNHPSDSLREAHFEQVTDIKDTGSLEMLFDYLDDNSKMVQRMALTELNALMGWRNPFEPKYDKKFFLKKRKDAAFKNELLLKLKVHSI